MVLEKAKELGLALCQSEEYVRMQESQAALEADSQLCAVMAEFRDKQEELMQTLQSEDGQDRLLVAAISRDVDALQGQLLENPIFQAAMEAQNSFQNLMQAVNREIAVCIGAPQEEEEGCSGSCSGCSGCGH